MNTVSSKVGRRILGTSAVVALLGASTVACTSPAESEELSSTSSAMKKSGTVASDDVFLRRSPQGPAFDRAIHGERVTISGRFAEGNKVYFCVKRTGAGSTGEWGWSLGGSGGVTVDDDASVPNGRGACDTDDSFGATCVVYWKCHVPDERPVYRNAVGTEALAQPVDHVVAVASTASCGGPELTSGRVWVGATAPYAAIAAKKGESVKKGSARYTDLKTAQNSCRSPIRAPESLNGADGAGGWIDAAGLQCEDLGGDVFDMVRAGDAFEVKPWKNGCSRTAPQFPQPAADENAQAAEQPEIEKKCCVRCGNWTRTYHVPTNGGLCRDAGIAACRLNDRGGYMAQTTTEECPEIPADESNGIDE